MPRIKPDLSCIFKREPDRRRLWIGVARILSHVFYHVGIATARLSGNHAKHHHAIIKSTKILREICKSPEHRKNVWRSVSSLCACWATFTGCNREPSLNDVSRFTELFVTLFTCSTEWQQSECLWADCSSLCPSEVDLQSVSGVRGDPVSTEERWYHRSEKAASCFLFLFTVVLLTRRMSLPPLSNHRWRSRGNNFNIWL